MATRMPDLKEVSRHQCFCTDTNGKGSNYIIEMDPEYPNQVGYCYAFSGTGMKMTSAIGYITMEMLKGNKDYKSMFWWIFIVVIIP